MKRAVWFVGLLMLVVSGCGSSDDGDKNSGPAGDVDKLQSTVEVDRLEGIVADGVDAASITIVARDEARKLTQNRSVSIVSSEPTDEIVLGAADTDPNGVATATIHAVRAGKRVITIRVDSVSLNVDGHVLTLDFVAGPASKLSFLSPPGRSQAARPLQPAIKIEAADAHGNRVLDFTDDVTLKVEGADVSQTVAAVDGIATFEEFRIDQPGSGKRLIASAGGVSSVTSEAFEVTPGTPARLAFKKQPVDVEAGAPLVFEVLVLDAAGNPVETFGAGGPPAVLARLYSNPTAALMEGTYSRPALGGLAKFEDLQINRSATGYSLAVFAEGYEGAVSDSFRVLPAPASEEGSSFGLVPGAVVADGVSAASIRIRAVDAFGNEIPNISVRLSVDGTASVIAPQQNLVTNAIGRVEAKLTSTVAEVKTVRAEIDGLFTLQASATFLPGAAVDSGSSMVTDADTASVDGGEIQFAIKVVDVADNPVPGQSVSISSTGGSNTWSPGAATMTDAEGNATFTLTSTKSEIKTITAVVGSVSLYKTVEFTPGRPALGAGKSGIESGNTPRQQAPVGTALPLPFVVVIRDDFGNPIPDSTVQFNVGPNLGTNGGSLNGAPDRSLVNVITDADGLASVTYTLGTTEATYTVTAVGDWGPENPQPGDPPVGQLTFTANAVAGAATTLAPVHVGLTNVAVVGTDLSGRLAANTNFGVSTPVRIGVLATDQFDNPVRSVPIAFSLVSGPATPASTINTNVITVAGTGLAYATGRVSSTAGETVYKAVCLSTSTLCSGLTGVELTFTLDTTPAP